MRHKIAVTGAGGYIGSVLAHTLLENNYNVKAVDMFFFGDASLSRHRNHPFLEIIRQDTRSIEHDVFEDCDSVIDLAALSNDPSGDLDPELTRSINERAARASRWLPSAPEYVATSSRARAPSTAPAGE